jgi:hypothetical protein
MFDMLAILAFALFWDFDPTPEIYGFILINTTQLAAGALLDSCSSW